MANTANNRNYDYNSHKWLRFLWALFFVGFTTALLIVLDFLALTFLCNLLLLALPAFIFVAWLFFKAVKAIASCTFYVSTGFTLLALLAWGAVIAIATRWLMLNCSYSFDNDMWDDLLRPFLPAIAFVQVFLGVIRNIKTCKHCGASGWAILCWQNSEKIGERYDFSGTSDVTIGTATVTFSDGSTATGDVKGTGATYTKIEMYRHHFYCRHCYCQSDEREERSKFLF